MHIYNMSEIYLQSNTLKVVGGFYFTEYALYLVLQTYNSKNYKVALAKLII